MQCNNAQKHMFGNIKFEAQHMICVQLASYACTSVISVISLFASKYSHHDCSVKKNVSMICHTLWICHTLLALIH